MPNPLERVMMHADYQAVFGSPEGKRVLQHICKVGFLTRPTRIKGDPEQSLENEGMRRLALSILRFANVDHAEIVDQIEKEYRNAGT